MEKISILKELWEFLKSRKKWWLFPIIIFLIILSVIIAFAESSAIAPLIYPLF